MSNIDKTDITNYPIDAQAFSENVAKAMYDFAVCINRICLNVNEMISALNESLLPVVKTVTEYSNSLSYAQVHHPKWFHMAIYCKKRRIREKYMKRILQLYRTEVTP